MPLGTVWSQEEDQRLQELVRLHGPKKWSQIAADLDTNKGSKQCRRRWKNFLSLDDRKLGSWTPEEDAQLLECHKKHGNKWTLIAQEIGGRTDNAVKNRWAALEKKRQLHEGYEQPRSSYSRGGSDLLGVRRVISKDQPQRSYGSRQNSGLMEAAWLQDSLEQSAAAAAAVAQQQQQQHDQAAYTMQPAAAFGTRQPGSVASSMPMAKPDLKINIPGATAPELPYSQRSQAPAGADHSRLQKAGGFTPREVWLDQGKCEDDALLSTSRQGAQAAMAGLQTPTEEPGMLADLYRFLYSGTPAAQVMAAGAAAAAAAAAGQPGPAAPWRDTMQTMPQQQLQQQQLPATTQMLPASSAPYMSQQQLPMQQQQSMYAGHVSAPQDVGAAFMQAQQPGRMLPPQGMHYSQPQLQQPMHALSKLSRTVSGFEAAPHPASMPQPSLPTDMVMRQTLAPPQPRFVPQGPPQGPGVTGGSMMTHSSTAVTTAAGGFQPPASTAAGYQAPAWGMGQMSQVNQMQGQEQQQQHMMHRQQMPVLSQQQQPPAAHLMPQEPLLPPQQLQPQQHMLRAQHADMQGPQLHVYPPPAHPANTTWNAANAEQWRQLLDVLQDGAGAELQAQVLPPPPALQATGLCHIETHHVADEIKLEHANNVTGSLTAAT